MSDVGSDIGCYANGSCRLCQSTPRAAIGPKILFTRSVFYCSPYHANSSKLRLLGWPGWDGWDGYSGKAATWSMASAGCLVGVVVYHPPPSTTSHRPKKKTINRVLSASKVIARVQQRKRKLLHQKNNSGKWKCVTCVIAQLNWIFHTFLQLPVMVRSGQDGCRGVWGILLDYGPATGEKSINTRLVWNTIQTTEF